MRRTPNHALRRKGYGTEEAGGEEGAFFVVVFDDGEGLAAGFGAWLSLEEPIGPGFQIEAFPQGVVGELFVANEAVGPKIGDLDREIVPPWHEGLGDVDAEGGLPQDSEIVVVKLHLRDHLNVAEVE